MSSGTKHIITAALTAAGIAAAALPALAQATGEPYKLPFPYVFSGPLIEFGERVWNEGMLPAVEIINKKGGIKGRPLEFYKVDVRFPETALWITEFRRLCENKDLPIVYGIGPTKSLVAIYEETKKCNIPVFNPSSTGAWSEKDYAGWIYRYQPTPEDVLPVVLKEAKARNNLKRIALTYTIDDEYAVYNFKVAQKIIKDIGIEIATEQTFRSKETNLASQVSAIRAARPDGVMLLHQPGDMGTLLLQLRDRGVDATVYADANVGGADFWRLSNGHAKGAIGYSLYSATDPRPIVHDWVKLWREKTKRPNDGPDGFVTAYYDATIVLAHVLNSAAALTREGVRDAFNKVRDLETISGSITWKEPGEVSRSKPVLVQVGDAGVLKTWP
ncbi:MAG: amino acid ABC transporter substrate-binding protein [Alphaproteobacteria bacterium]|nr:amino acid ABC transporter substrate-binding protein [Alphaproteobacteria bacterium]